MLSMSKRDLNKAHLVILIALRIAEVLNTRSLVFVRFYLYFGVQ